ncbi:histidine phosphatase family protein, partial [Candidatus Pelagibacter sp.]|nr:histidine phosphatase family protein [Candidatus Pelagibacter sp.]
ALNSFFSAKFAKNEKRQINDLKNYIKNWKSNKNLILVTHYVVISSMLNTPASSGEIVVSDKNYEIIGTIDTM